MPKVYSETERTDIKDNLKREANILMIERGIKKTTVDELVKKSTRLLVRGVVKQMAEAS